ncbi:MAG: winged helix-turn-helix domain-containing protein, partial [Desulfomonilaceae bacterium]
MAIPDFQTVMLPLLKLLTDGQEHSVSELVEKLSASFGLSEQEVKQLLPSGQRTFYNRVLWARVYLSKAGLLATPSRGNYQITDEGKNVLSQNPERIDMKFLEQFPGYLVFKGTKKKKNQDAPNELTIESKLTPDEVFSEAYNEIRNKLSQDLLSRVKECSSFFFERLVVGLLVKMGYGDFTRENSGKAKATGGSNDGGIDGIIPQDKLRSRRCRPARARPRRPGATTSVMAPTSAPSTGASRGWPITWRCSGTRPASARPATSRGRSKEDCLSSSPPATWPQTPSRRLSR